MANLQVVEGRLSDSYNIFREFKLVSITATDTRLMGVVALRLEWTSLSQKSGRLYQIIHLDYSEYGIDDYYEFLCMPDDVHFADNRRMMKSTWTSMISAMGGREVSIDKEVAAKLIELAIDIYKNSKLCKSGEDEHADFRKYAMKRIRIMNLPIPESLTAEEAYRYVVPRKIASYETINYFLMRIIDDDYSVLPLLTNLSEDELRDTGLSSYGLQSLIKCNISSVPKSSNEYTCKFVTLGERYFFGYASIHLNGGPRDKNRLIDNIDLQYYKPLSPYESAMLTKRTEYITVYDVDDSMLNMFDLGDLTPLSFCDPKLVDNGWLYTIYNETNGHVNRAEFHLNDDVFGTALLTIAGELIIMSYRLTDITLFENSMLLSESINKIHLKGRYQLDDQVFKAICDTTGAMFEDLIVY